MALATVRNLIESSLLLAGAINKGADPDPDEYNDGLDVLNAMLGSWETESLMLPYVASAKFQTVAGKASYSIGPGGDWDNVRPDNIINGWYERDNLTLPLTQMAFDQYGDIPTKTVTSSDPYGFMYNASYPLGYFVLYPVPDRVVNVVLSFDAMFGGVTLDTDLTTLPGGYIHAIRYGLAMLMPAEYGKNVSNDIKVEAVRAKGVIKRRNLKAIDAILDPALPGMQGQRGWDWRTGG